MSPFSIWRNCPPIVMPALVARLSGSGATVVEDSFDSREVKNSLIRLANFRMAIFGRPSGTGRGRRPAMENPGDFEEMTEVRSKAESA